MTATSAHEERGQNELVRRDQRQREEHARRACPGLPRTPIRGLQSGGQFPDASLTLITHQSE